MCYMTSTNNTNHTNSEHVSCPKCNKRYVTCPCCGELMELQGQRNNPFPTNPLPAYPTPLPTYPLPSMPLPTYPLPYAPLKPMCVGTPYNPNSRWNAR